MRRPSLVALACTLSAATATLAAGAVAAASDPRYDYFPQWSPDGGRIAFEQDGALTVMDASGRALRQLPGWMPADVSRDGRVVFTVKHAHGGTHLVVARYDGSGLRRVTSGPYDDTFPHWSPDGQTILFERRWRGQDIWSVRADGRTLRRLTRDGRSSLGFTTEPWAPDGRRFAFEGCTGRRCGDIYVLDAAGRGTRRRLTRRHDNESATWSPDGSLIAFLTGGDTEVDPPVTADLNVVRPDGTGRRNVARARSRGLRVDDRDGREMSWSPDGRSIVFAATSSRAADGPSELWVVSRDGTRSRLLIRGAGRQGAEDHVPAWSPDGRRIAFARVVGLHDEDAPLAASIYTVRPDGSGLRRVTR